MTQMQLSSRFSTSPQMRWKDVDYRLYLCWTCKRKCLLNINIQYSWSGDKGANKHRLLESQRGSRNRDGPRWSNLRRMRQVVPKTDSGHSLKLRARANVPSLSPLHDEGPSGYSPQEWEYQSRNSLKSPTNPDGTGVGGKMRALLRVPKQTRERNTCSWTLPDLRADGWVPVRVEDIFKAFQESIKK